MTASAAPDDGPSLTLLIKLLKMTTSSNDGEVCIAARKANGLLGRHFGGDWEALLRGKVTVIGDPFADMPAPPKKEATPTPRAPQRPAPRTPPRATPPFSGSPTFGSATSAAQAAAQARATAQQTKQQWSQQQAARRAAMWKPGPSGGKLRSNLYAGPCVKCGNQVPVDDGFSFKDSSWNTTSRWQIACHPCFYKGAPAGYAAPKAATTSIDLDSLV